MGVGSATDQVGEQLEGIAALIDRYRKAGLHDISHDFDSRGRHEMLNEINRKKVLQICSAGWLEYCRSRPVA